MNFVYVPQHLYPALKKAGLRSQEWRDIEKLVSTLSADDVAFYLYANEEKSCPVPKALGDTLPNLFFGDGQIMPFTSSEQSKSVVGKLLSLKANGSNASLYEDGAVLTSDCEEEDLLILTHVAPADAESGETTLNDETAFYDRIIQQLLVFRPLSQVLSSPVVAGWMKSVQATS